MCHYPSFHCITSYLPRYWSYKWVLTIILCKPIGTYNCEHYDTFSIADKLNTALQSTKVGVFFEPVLTSGYEAWNSATGSSEMKEWPTWANVLIGILIGIAIIWIPVVWLLKYAIKAQ